jgi:hypothetical protein
MHPTLSPEPFEPAARRRPQTRRPWAAAATGLLLAAASVIALSRSGSDVSEHSMGLAEVGAGRQQAALGRTQMLTPTPLKNRAEAEAESAKAEQFAERIAALPALGGSARAVLRNGASESEHRAPRADARKSLQVC